jgi:hypothetical protein
MQVPQEVLALLIFACSKKIKIISGWIHNKFLKPRTVVQALSPGEHGDTETSRLMVPWPKSDQL